MLSDFADVFGAIHACMDEAKKQTSETEKLRARIAELEAEIKRLSNKKLLQTDVARERIYNCISAWTSAPETVCSRATEGIVRIVNDHFGG